MSTQLTYGSTVYLKNQGDDNQNRWLSGCRDSGNNNVRTSNKETEKDRIKTYKWEIWKRWNDMGSGDIQSGDYLYLRCLFMDDRWLTGGWEPDNKGVRTDNGGTQFGTSYEWRVSLRHDDDDVGRPIYFGDAVYFAVYLRVEVVDNPGLFLSGGRTTGNNEVRTQKDIDKPGTFQWMLEEVERYDIA